jgi:hypothetical protein
VNSALNAELFVPPGASSAGTLQFFIPFEDDGSAAQGITVSIGSQFAVSGAPLWDICQTGCTAGAATMLNSTPATYLVFSPVAGQVDVSKVAAEGETLLDGTVLRDILLKMGSGLDL